MKTASLKNRSRMSWRAAAIGLLAILSLASIIRGDLIYFTKGGEAQLPARVEGNRVLLSMPDGEIELSREDVRKIVPGFWPAAEWPARRQKALAGGFDARFAAMWWALENGLTEEVAEEVRALHRAGPEARANRANGFRSRPARRAVPRPRFQRLSESARNRGERRARAACASCCISIRKPRPTSASRCWRA